MSNTEITSANFRQHARNLFQGITVAGEDWGKPKMDKRDIYAHHRPELFAIESVLIDYSLDQTSWPVLEPGEEAASDNRLDQYIVLKDALQMATANSFEQVMLNKGQKKSYPKQIDFAIKRYFRLAEIFGGSREDAVGRTLGGFTTGVRIATKIIELIPRLFMEERREIVDIKSALVIAENSERIMQILSRQHLGKFGVIDPHLSSGISKFIYDTEFFRFNGNALDFKASTPDHFKRTIGFWIDSQWTDDVREQIARHTFFGGDNFGHSIGEELFCPASIKLNGDKPNSVSRLYQKTLSYAEKAYQYDFLVRKN